MRKFFVWLLICLIIPVSARADFLDVPGTHWAKVYIDDLVKREIFSGYANGYFGPEDVLTRAAFAILAQPQLYSSLIAVGIQDVWSNLSQK